MKRKRMACILVFMLFVLVTGCMQQSTEAELSETKTAYLMGTMVTVKVYGPAREEVADKVLNRFTELENLLSLNIPESEVNQINANAGVKPVKVSADTFAVLKRSLDFAEMSDGLFDPSIGILVKLWGIGTSNSRLPGDAEIKKALSLINYKNIEVDEAASTVFLKVPGMIIDLGAIAKGYAADQAIKIFKADKRVKSAFVNLGGNVMVHGKKPDKSLWTIGIQDPRKGRDEVMATIQLEDKTVVSSGDYERYFEKNGKRYHHILNSKTGYPAESGLISTSIIGPSSTDSDGLSTSTFLLGPEKGMELVKKLGYEALFITKDKKIYMTDGLKGKMEFMTKEYHQ